MELQDLKKSIETLGSDWAAFKKENDERLKAIEKKGVADPLIQEKLDKMNKSMDESIERIQKIEAMKNSSVEVETKTINEKLAKEEKSAVNAWMKKGRAIEMKSLVENVDSQGGFLVRPEVSNDVQTKIFESSPIRQLATVLSIGGDSFEEPACWDEPEAGWVGETETRSGTNTPALKQLMIPLHEMHASPKASQRLLDDSFVDVEAWHGQKVAEKFARLEATGFVSGDGINKPLGFLSYAAGDDYNKIEQVNSGHASQLTADGLIALQAALLEQFQPNATWLMKRATVGAVRQLKAGTTGEYLWGYEAQLNTPMQMSLLGRPVMFANDMPSVGANALAVAYGDFRAGYLIVEKPGIRVLRDAFTAKPYVLFYTTKRVGGGVRHFQAIKVQKISA
jgi:HK97 family phage major capsid protein